MGGVVRAIGVALSCSPRNLRYSGDVLGLSGAALGRLGAVLGAVLGRLVVFLGGGTQAYL